MQCVWGVGGMGSGGKEVNITKWILGNYGWWKRLPRRLEDTRTRDILIKEAVWNKNEKIDSISRGPLYKWCGNPQAFQTEETIQKVAQEGEISQETEGGLVGVERGQYRSGRSGWWVSRGHVWGGPLSWEHDSADWQVGTENWNLALVICLYKDEATSQLLVTRPRGVDHGQWSL